MEDFETRLLAPFRRVLAWRFNVTTITTKVHTGKILHEHAPAARFAFVPKYPDRKYLEVFIHFPEKYILELEAEDWRVLATPLPQTCATLLYALGLEAATADAGIDVEEKCFVFWVPITEEVYNRLPPILEPLPSKFFGIEGVLDEEEEQRILRGGTRITQ